MTAFRPGASQLSKSLLLSFAIVPALHMAAFAQAPQVRDPNSVLVGPPPVLPASPPEPPVVQQDIEVVPRAPIPRSSLRSSAERPTRTMDVV